jgi:hypothetical protein
VVAGATAVVPTVVRAAGLRWWGRSPAGVVTAGDAGAFSRSVTIPGGASGTVSFPAVG